MTYAVRYDYITHYCPNLAAAIVLCAEFNALGLNAQVIYVERQP